MLSIYILILGFISGVTMETCPETEDIFPCRCSQLQGDKTISVDCISFSETTMTLKELQHVLNGLLGKNDVELKLYRIQDTLPSNIFSGIGITRLEFWSCDMDSLTNADQPGLLGLENHLLELTVFKSDLSALKLHLGHLNKLKRISFVGNNIPELEDDWLSDAPPSLKELAFSLNNIGKIGNHAFSRLNSLRELALEDNRVSPMKRSMFPDRLEIFHLHTLDDSPKSLKQKIEDAYEMAVPNLYWNNSLTDLPVDFFRNMPLIDYVDLDHNRLTTLDERTWSPIWKKMEYLTLEGNNIICDDRLNWITKPKYRPIIEGKCSAPKELEKMTIGDFIISNTR